MVIHKINKRINDGSCVSLSDNKVTCFNQEITGPDLCSGKKEDG